jgi:lipopolysaccharide transport system permease protein
MNSKTTTDLKAPLHWHAAPKSWTFPDLRELWEQRSLMIAFAARDIRVRYRQTLVGVAWALLQPLAMTLVFVIFFQLLGRNPSNSGTPFAVTLCCGLIPWQFFTNGVSLCTSSLVTNQQIITKVYFPRMVLPISTLLAAGADMAVALLVLTGFFAFYSVPLTWTVLILPFFAVQLLLMTLSLGLWLAAANAIYRDVEQAVPFCLQIMFFLSPVIYETEALVPPQWRTFFLLNPIAGIIEGFRWSLLGETPFPWLATCSSLLVTTILLAGGLLYFRRVERFVADRI